MNQPFDRQLLHFFARVTEQLEELVVAIDEPPASLIEIPSKVAAASMRNRASRSAITWAARFRSVISTTDHKDSPFSRSSCAPLTSTQMAARPRE